MSKSLELQSNRDLAKLFCFLAALAGTAATFAVMPSLFYSTLISLIVTTLLSPLVVILERKGLSRVLAITSIYGILGISLLLLGFSGIQLGISEWDGFKEKAPESFLNLISQLRERELSLIKRFPYLEGILLTDSIVQLGQDTKKWFVDYGLSAASQFLTLSFLVPLISFILLKDSRKIQKFFFYLVPNRFFESFFLISNEIATAISNFIRAKLFEAVIVGLLVTVGLMCIGAPSPVILGLLAGVTNIIPYLGPAIGFVPGILLATSIHSHDTLLYSMSAVYLIANLIDMVVIFPLFVGKLIKLHPFVLIGAVVIGQKYYGLIGMLISVPVAASLKVIFREVYIAVYEQRLPTESESL